AVGDARMVLSDGKLLPEDVIAILIRQILKRASRCDRTLLDGPPVCHGSDRKLLPIIVMLPPLIEGASGNLKRRPLLGR
ncbi:hypothetical protein ACLOJK_038129, partial [Asimina triloba]